MIGKTLLDKFGVTEKLDETQNAIVNISAKINKDELSVLKKDIQDCNITAQVDIIIKQHGLSNIEGLPEHINVSKLKTSDVNNLIQTHNNKNIANQAHGFKGVNIGSVVISLKVMTGMEVYQN